MTDADDAALREAQKQAGEIYLAGHLEKHQMEAERAETAMAHNMQRVADHRAHHEVEHKTHLTDHEQYRATHAALHDAIGAAHDNAHRMEQLAVTTALEAVSRERQIHAEAHEREHVSHGAIHELAQLAVNKAEVAVEARLHDMNAVRDQLREQSATFVRIEAFDTFKDERRHALTALEANIESKLESLRNLIQTEREERRGSEGQRKGISQSTAVIAGAITLAATIISIIIVVMNFVGVRT